MGGGTPTKVVQITNIAPQATKDQMQALFGLLGKIDELRLYPSIRDVSIPVISRICYVRFAESSSVAIAQHMTNTVFIDRALICIPVSSGVIPEEYRALEMSANGTLVPGFGTNAPESKLPPEVVTKVVGKIPNQIIRSFHPKLDDDKLPEYPDLPVHFDERKVEETRRTILVLNHDLKVKMIDLMEHFKQAGEVKYARTAVHDYGRRIYMIEFAEQASVIAAFEKLHGSYYKGVYLNLHHSTQPIEKPEAKSNEAAQKEIEEAMSIVKECHNQISAVIDPAFSVLSKDKTSSSSRRRSRSRSRSRKHRSRSVESRSRSKRSRSRKRSKTPRENRSRRSRKRSKSRRLSRSSSRKKRSKRSSSRRPESRSRSKDRRHRRRDRSRGHHKRSSRNRSRSKSRDRRSKSRDRRTKSRERSRSRHKSERKKKSHRSEKKDERKYSHSRSRSRTSTRKSPSAEKTSSRSSKRRSAERKVKKNPEERGREYEAVRDYDAEEKIGLDDGNGCEKSSSKSDNMDISP